jgi:uncharacterized membrane protein
VSGLGSTIARVISGRLTEVRQIALSPITIAFLTVCCVVVAEVRRIEQLEPGYGFLRWNLVIAWVPLVLAYALAWASRRDATLVLMSLLAVVWIVFLPNAPYLVTDLVHLRVLFSIPNAITLGLLAVVGLLIGVKSVAIVQCVVEEHFGVRAGWRGVRLIAALSALGIYLGRVLRWNSWNLVSDPQELAHSLLRGPAESDRVAIGMPAALLFGIAFYAAYRLLTAHQPPGMAPSRTRRGT